MMIFSCSYSLTDEDGKVFQAFNALTHPLGARAAERVKALIEVNDNPEH